MSEAPSTSSTPLPAIQALAERIEAQTPHLHVMSLFEQPHPYVKVKDTVHGIVVGFSSEEDYVTYCRIVSVQGGQHHG